MKKYLPSLRILPNWHQMFLGWFIDEIYKNNFSWFFMIFHVFLNTFFEFSLIFAYPRYEFPLIFRKFSYLQEIVSPRLLGWCQKKYHFLNVLREIRRLRYVSAGHRGIKLWLRVAKISVFRDFQDLGHGPPHQKQHLTQLKYYWFTKSLVQFEHLSRSTKYEYPWL